MRIGTNGALMVAAVVLAMGAAASFAQECDDFDACTTNDMCSDGMCAGTFQIGAGCSDFDDCTTNDRCVDDPILGPGCAGDPAPMGTSCAGGCGTCQPFQGLGMVCMGDGSTSGHTCDPGLDTPCLDGACQVTGGFAFCFPSIRVCDDTDGNPCTDSCDPQTGQCSATAPKCFTECETCNTSTGNCEPARIGQACDDFDVCTTQSRCEPMDFGEGMTRGLCVSGEPTPGTPTPNTPTPTLPPVGGCTGDCNGNNAVVVNELIIGVNIALGNQPISACPSFDRSGNDAVEVNELVQGVNASLSGCPT